MADIDVVVDSAEDINISLDATGPQGIQGETGEKGDQGIQGETGEAGTTDYNNLDNKPTTITTQQATDISTNNDKISYTGVASDHGAESTDQIINVCYGTGDPPAANTTTEGALFIKYE